MKTKIKLLIGAAAIITAAGLALSTPLVKLVSPLLAVGNQKADIHKRGTAVVSNGEPFRVELETDGPATFSIQDAAFAAGGQNGWHSHPGLVAVTIISGSIRWYDENCNPTEYKEGDSWWRVVKFMPSATSEPIPCTLWHRSSPQRVRR